MITFLNGSSSSGGAVAFADITGDADDNASLLLKADKTSLVDITFAKGTGPVVVSPDDASHRIGADNADNVTTEDVA